MNRVWTDNFSGCDERADPAHHVEFRSIAAIFARGTSMRLTTPCC